MSGNVRRQMIDGLRAVADFYESSAGAYYDGMTVVLRMFSAGRGAVRELTAMADAFGDWQNLSDGRYVVIAKGFGGKVRLELFCPRSKVCRRILLGTRTEPACILPAREAVHIPERVIQMEDWLLPFLPGGGSKL